MRMSEIREHLLDFVSAGISVMLYSSPGRGKSTLIDDSIDYLSNRDGFQWGLSTIFLATWTPTELTGYVFKDEEWWDSNGLLVPKGTEDVKPTLVSAPTLPFWMRDDRTGLPIWAFQRGLIFFDEWGQGETDSKRAAAEIWLNGRYGPFKIPGFKTGNGWGVVGASNYSTDRSGVTKEQDFFINRRAELHVTDHIDDTVNHLKAKGRGLHPILIVFAEKFPHIVLSPGVPEKQGPWMTPRTLEKTSDLFWVKEDRFGHVPYDSSTQEATSGLIGFETAREVFNLVRLDQEMPKYGDIVADPAGVPVPEGADSKMLICYNLAARVTEKDAAKVLVYVDRLGKEFGVTFAKSACTRMPLLVMTPAFTQWSKGNSSLMALMQQLK